jgi:hypothetical protein
MPGLGLPDTPSELDGLFRFLSARQFVVVEDGPEEDGRRVVLRGPVEGSARGDEAEVQIWAEQSRWSIGLRLDGMPDFVDARLWMAYLDGTPVEDCALSDQAKFVASRLVDAASAAVGDPGLVAALLRLGRQHNGHQGPGDGTP